MLSKKIKFWARLGQILFFLYQFCAALFEMELATFDESMFSDTVAESIYAILCLAFLIFFSEAIVRLIIYFSELLEKRKKNGLLIIVLNTKNDL